MSSDTPKKKAQPKKKAAPKKPAQSKSAPGKKPGTGKRGRPPKAKTYDANAKDTDATKRIRKELEEVAAGTLTGIYSSVDEMVDELQREALEVADKIDEVADRVADSVVVFANDVKKASLRKRMLKWFKKK
jgi:hypothetical protein